MISPFTAKHPNNPVHGVKRLDDGANEGKTPALSDGQARKLLEVLAARIPRITINDGLDN